MKYLRVTLQILLAIVILACNSASAKPEEPFSEGTPLAMNKRDQEMLSSTFKRSLNWGEECPLAADGVRRAQCATANSQGKYQCIDEHQLCDGKKDCVANDDEDLGTCMFYKVIRQQIKEIEYTFTSRVRG